MIRTWLEEDRGLRVLAHRRADNVKVPMTDRVLAHAGGARPARFGARVR